MRNSTPETIGQEIVMTGLGVSHGIAVGPAYLVQIEHPQPPEYMVPPDQAQAEATRFDQSVIQAQYEIAELKEQSALLPIEAAEEIMLLLDAHLAMLSGSRLIRGARQ